MPEIPEITDPQKDAELIARRLAEMEDLLQESERLRFYQTVVSAITVLLMLGILTAFIFGLIGFFRSYPKRLLMREVVQQNRRILGNPYHFGVNSEYDRRTIRLFLEEAIKGVRRRRPAVRQEIRSELRFLNRYAAVDLRRRFRDRFYTRLTAETNQYLAQKKLQPDARRKALLDQFNRTLAEEAARKVFGDAGQAGLSAYGLFREEAELLRRSGMYQELLREPLDMTENRMMENLLECIVCRLNEGKGGRIESPEKGKQP
ncbi:MAG: hypothetical protein IJS14_04055 [Lentisphaeria bacterium]|nr:hypothetical protein [Lentisphaeria bacterium]